MVSVFFKETGSRDEFLWEVYSIKSVPEFIDPVFTKTSPKRSFSLNRKRAFWLVFAKTGSIISGTVLFVYAGTVFIFMVPG